MVLPQTEYPLKPQCTVSMQFLKAYTTVSKFSACFYSSFPAIGKAFAVLNDSDKRKRYDLYGDDTNEVSNSRSQHRHTHRHHHGGFYYETRGFDGKSLGTWRGWLHGPFQIHCLGFVLFRLKPWARVRRARTQNNRQASLSRILSLGFNKGPSQVQKNMLLVCWF